MGKATNAKELAKAMKENDPMIEITIDLKKKVIVIKGTKAIAWTIAIGAIGISVYLLMATPAATVTTAGAGGVVSFTGAAATGGAAVTILGIGATTFAISLGVAAGGVGVLTTLRDKYDIIENQGKYFLKRK